MKLESTALRRRHYLPVLRLQVACFPAHLAVISAVLAKTDVVLRLAETTIALALALDLFLVTLHAAESLGHVANSSAFWQMKEERGANASDGAITKIGVSLDWGCSPDERKADRVSAGPACRKLLGFLEGDLVVVPMAVVADLVNP